MSYFYQKNSWSILAKCLSVSDITFIHEGNKTFHDNLVNFEKLVSSRTLYKNIVVLNLKCLMEAVYLYFQHMIADTVRFIRQCQKDHMGQYSDN